MLQTQYLKMLEMELQKINKIIDKKILKGQDYMKEAKDHKLILKKIKYNTRRRFFDRFSFLRFQ